VLRQTLIDKRVVGIQNRDDASIFAKNALEDNSISRANA
jgi:hypothetical protein